MNTKKKKARGITLIALVITIIVLLILAGVTINALSGENGILKRATQAKSKTGRSNALEQINLAIITARTEGLGQVDKKVLRDEITKAGMTVKTDGDDLPWEVVSDKYIFRINEDYTVEEISGIGLSKKEIKLASGENETITATLTEGVTGTITWESSAPDIVKVENGKITAVGESGTATITAKVEGTEYQAICKVTVKSNKINGAIEVGEYEKYYGKKVTNYTAGGKTYRIFYIDTEGKFGDKNTVYLKADWTANDITLSSYTSYTPSGTDLITYKKLNSSWAAQRGSSTSSWNSNEHVAAWLCSPSKWTTYCDTSKANYAIGSPTAEMYVASYNQVSHTTGNYKLGATYRATDYPGYIYTLNGKQSTISNDDYWTGRDSSLDYTGYNSMYCGRNGSKGDYWWWLASPSALYSNIVCCVDGNGASLGGIDYGGTHGVCPIVSLKSSFQLEIEQ